MKQNVLFIADSSLNNPILQSQGIPFLAKLDLQKYTPFVLSFEETRLGKNEGGNINPILKQYVQKINFFPVVIVKKRLFPEWLYDILFRTKILYSISKEHNIKLIHARSFKPALISIIIKLFFIPSIKVIYDNRGLYIDELIFNNGLIRGSFKEKIYRYAEKLIIDKSNKIVVVSYAFKSYLENYFSKNIKNISSKTEVIANRTQLYIDESAILAKQKQLDDKITCVYSGSTASWQGVDLFYIVFSKILEQMPNTYFKILSYQPEVFQNSEKENEILNERIVIKNVEYDKVKFELFDSTFGIILRKKDIVSNVSAPIKFAEYLSAGLPVILHEGIGDTERVIEKYNVGIIIKNYDYDTAISKLVMLLEDKEVHNRCLKAAQKEFDLKISHTQYLNIYEELLFNLR